MIKRLAIVALLVSSAAAFAVRAQSPATPSAPEPELKERVDCAVENGLRYLRSQQKPDGTFPGSYGDSVAIPALAGMAFLSKGYLPGRAPYGEAIDRAIDFVLAHADVRDNAPFKGYMGDAGGGRMYAHAIATLFLSEVSGMVDDERQDKIDAILPQAVKVIVDAQKQRKGGEHVGGWRYTPNAGDSDLSCSGWALMALRSARLNGAQVPPESIDMAVKYVARSQNGNSGAFSYQGNGGQYGEHLTGAAILCLELCGRHAAPESMKGAKYLRDVYQRELAGGGNYVVYALYYAAQGLFQIGGDYWTEFAPWMYETWLKRQTPEGAWSNEISPAYSTAMVILAFTVPYRQLPIYQRDETVNEDED